MLNSKPVLFINDQQAEVIKINVTGTGEWLDPSTLQLQFTLVNENTTAANNLFLLGQPHTFFRRARLLCGGQVVEDIDQYNRVHEMLSILGNRENRDMDDIAGVQGRIDNIECTRHMRAGTFIKTNVVGGGLIKGIKGNGGKKSLARNLRSDYYINPNGFPYAMPP